MIEFTMQAMLGGGIRFAEAILSSGPTLLVGLFIAAVFRYFLGTEGTRRLFGGDSVRSLPQSWAVGMLLPVCSIGVLPILLEMRRSGIKPGAMSAFALAAPLFNPLSLLYGLTLSRPYVIVMFAIGSLAVVTLVGLVWDKVFLRQKTEKITDSSFLEIAGVQRLAATFIFMCRQLCGPAGLWALIAAFGMATLAVFLPWGAMQHGVNRDDWWAPARMTLIAIPAYATPMLIMSQLGMMFQHANSPGAAFVLLVLGAGVNFGTIGWLGRQFGVRSVVLWAVSLVLIVLAISYGVNKPLIPPGVDPSEHTHAFDIYSNPIHHLDSAMGSFALKKLGEKIGIAERITLWALGIGLVLGGVFRLFSITCEKPRQRSESAAADKQPYGRFDRGVSERVVGGTLLAGLVVLSVVMCYAYYPSPEECLKQISHVRAETLSAARTGAPDHAMFWIPRWDEWSRRLEVGTFIRRGKVTPYQRMQGYLIRKKLETLEHELAHDHNDPAMIREVVKDVSNTNSRWVRAFQDLPPVSSHFGSAQAIITDPDVDSLHDHKHFHKDSQSHDHDHGDFVGAHQHDHAHAHRHDEAPHGGKIVDLGHSQHASQTGDLHLEVMPVRDGKIEIYPLQYKLGAFRPVKDPGISLMLNLQSPQKDQEVELDLELDKSAWVFQKSLPHSLLSAESLDFVATYVVGDDRLEAFVRLSRE